MTVIEMVAEYLKQNGYDGLYSDDGECACEIGDIAPCNTIGEQCHAGYRYWCEDADCEYTADAGRHWHMRKVK